MIHVLKITPVVINVKSVVIHVKETGHFLIGRNAFWSDIIKS